MCKLYNCTDENPCHYCQRQAERAKKKPIKPRSDKRSKQETEYNKKRKDYLNKYILCQAGLTGCTKVATTIHHLEGRIGALLTDTDNFIALCMNCHVFVENSPIEAKKMGFSVRRIK